MVKNYDRLNRDLSRLIVIDHSPDNYKMHPQNAILIDPFTDNREDNQLLLITEFIEMLYQKEVPDVRKYIQKFNELRTKTRTPDLNDLLEIFKEEDKSLQQKEAELLNIDLSQVKQDSVLPLAVTTGYILACLFI